MDEAEVRGVEERAARARRPLTDGEAVRAVLAGRRDAYGILVRRHQDAIYRYVVRVVGAPDEAADIVQAALVKGYANLASCRNPDRVGVWLFKIAVNQVRDYWKSRRRRDVGLEEAGPVADESSDPDGASERAQIRERIRGALERLPPKLREAFVLRHLEGLTYPEIAERLGVSVPALKMRVHRARERLEGWLEEYR